MYIIIDIYSKNKNSLQYFLNFFDNILLNNKLFIFIFKIKVSKKTKKKIFTVLKSPHVNKSAQESLEQRFYKTRLKCFVPQIHLFLIFIKKLKVSFFSDVAFKIKLVSSTKTVKKQIKYNFNVNKYSLDFDKFNLIKYLKIYEVFGKFRLNF
jgi:ribosomal protein S10